MPRCGGSKPNGSPCERIVGASQGYCYAHDPGRAEERRRNASRAARSKPSRELSDIKRRLSEMADGVLAGNVNRSSAAVAGQLLNTVIRAVGVELKVREQQDLIERMEELERLLEQKDGGRQRWG